MEVEMEMDVDRDGSGLDSNANTTTNTSMIGDGDVGSASHAHAHAQTNTHAYPHGSPAAAAAGSAGGAGAGVSVICVKTDFRCQKCCEPVVALEDREWAADVNYLFFRNFYEGTNASKLVVKTTAAKEGTKACACQCSWSVTRPGEMLQTKSHWFKKNS
jgi:hypothetical protein